MIASLFDSPWKLLIVALVILVLFGSRKLPDFTRSIGKSMRILKTEVRSLHEDEDEHVTPAAAAPPAAVSPGPAPLTQQQQRVEELAQQLEELRKQSAAPQAQQTRQAG